MRFYKSGNKFILHKNDTKMSFSLDEVEYMAYVFKTQKVTPKDIKETKVTATKKESIQALNAATARIRKSIDLKGEVSEDNRLANFMRDLRVARNLSQSEIAQFLNYGTPQFISNWERGLAAPPLEDLKTICKFLAPKGADHESLSEKAFELFLEEYVEQTIKKMQLDFLKG